jgi:predicted phage terminase large subunit-like protein
MEAESEAIRSSTSAWYSDVLRTRAMPNAKHLMIGTRWHEDDVLGRVLREDGWTRLILPLIAEGDDEIGRNAGDWLWPEQFGPDSLDIPSVERGEISSRSFAALYQQRPVPMEGGTFKIDWFSNRYEGGLPTRTVTEPSGVNPYETTTYTLPTHIIMSIDCASKTGIGNDFSVLATIASDGVDFFIADIVRQRVEFTDLVRLVIETHRKYGHSHVFVEDASSGIQVVQELRRWSHLPVIPVTPQHSKIARAESLTGFFEAKRVRIPEHAPWIENFLAEFCSFPNGRHDDQVDAVIMGIAQMDRIIASSQHTDYLSHRLVGWMER